MSVRTTPTSWHCEECKARGVTQEPDPRIVGSEVGSRDFQIAATNTARAIAHSLSHDPPLMVEDAE